MAITKILYIGDCGKGNHGKHLKQSLAYVCKEEKTGGGRWISAVNCQPGFAYQQMVGTKELFHKTDKRQGYHMIISFEEGEVTADLAFEIVGEFVRQYLGRDYEAVYVIHDNTAHIHGHIIFNSVSFSTRKKYRYEKGDWAKYIQPITNSLCSRYGLSTITIEEDQALAHDNYEEWRERKDGRFVWSDMICRDLDICIAQASDFEEFMDLLSEKGYEIKQGKHLAVKPPGMSRYRRCRYFGGDYTEERIRERIVLESAEVRKELYGNAKIVRVNVPYRIRRAKLSGIQRRYFARLYRTGKLKKRPYSQAWKYRDEIKKMHQLHDEYMLLSKYEIHKEEDIEALCKQLDLEKKTVEKERRALSKEKAFYRGLFQKVERIEELSFAESAYVSGDTFFEDEHREYRKITGEIQNSGYSVDELKELIKEFKDRSARISEDYKSVGREYKIALRLRENTAYYKRTKDRSKEAVITGDRKSPRGR